jgi:hypothetical protein
MNALNVISSEWPTKSLSESTEEHPLLHSRITELQVHTLLGLNFNAHEIWTKAEIHEHLRKIAEQLNPASATICPNRLTDNGCWRHTEYIHKPKGGETPY